MHLVEEKLTLAVKDLADLASQQRVTQDSVDSLVEAIKALPSERRKVVAGILGQVAAGAFLKALLLALGVPG